MEEEKLIVNLETDVRDTELLQKNVQDCENKSFNSLLDYMLDPKEDDLNPAYNNKQEDIAELIQEWREKKLLNLRYRDENNDLHGVHLSDYVKDYDDIIKNIIGNTEFGEGTEYKGIELGASHNRPGGY